MNNTNPPEAEIDWHSLSRARGWAMPSPRASAPSIPETDSYGRERTPPRDYQRPEARLPVDRCDFWRLDAVAHLPLAPADRALIGAP